MIVLPNCPAGSLKDLTGNYRLSFVFCTVASCIGALVYFIGYRFRRDPVSMKGGGRRSSTVGRQGRYGRGRREM